jgi:1-acyl-sn-glycerol-3-phosphate acyltransferase
VLRWSGGRPVDRHNSSGAVEQLARQIEAEPWYWFGISPEGTRKRTDRLRSGFYYLALRLDIPVGLGYIDYPAREVGMTEFVRMSGDRERDLDVLRRYYAGKVPRFPGQASPIIFREKESASPR